MCYRIQIVLTFYAFIVFVSMRTRVFCFNFEQRDPLVKEAPDDQKDSYFGFSVAQHKTFENGGVDDSW